MKFVLRFATLSTFLLCVLPFALVPQSNAQSNAQGVAKDSPQTPGVVPYNLVEGVGPINSEGSWGNYSALSVIAGPSILSKASNTTVFYIGFTGGTTAIVGNMVLYKTLTRGSKITAVTPVKLGGISNPTIKISDTSVCPSQPISTTNPCIVRLDPLTLTLSSADDYYLVIYFASGTDVSSTHGAFNASGLTGWFLGNDLTQLKVGQSVPTGDNTQPYFLMSVMSD